MSYDSQILEKNQIWNLNDAHQICKKKGKNASQHWNNVTESFFLRSSELLSWSLYKFSAYYGIIILITVFISTCKWSLHRHIRIQPKFSYPISLRHFYIKYSYLHPGLPSDPCPALWPTKAWIYTWLQASAANCALLGYYSASTSNFLPRRKNYHYSLRNNPEERSSLILVYAFYYSQACYTLRSYYPLYLRHVCWRVKLTEPIMQCSITSNFSN
jgi:hypothetical protein